MDRSGTVEALEDALRTVVAHEGVRGVLILGCSANGFTPERVDPILQHQDVPVVGGLFPAILAGEEMLEVGTILVGLTMALTPVHVEGLDGNDRDYVAQIDAGLAAGSGAAGSGVAGSGAASTVLVLLDAFAPHIDRFIEALYTVLGPEKTYLGGGVGSLEMDRSPALLSNRGMTTGGALLLVLDTASCLGVGHGWTPVAGPFRVTESEGVEIRSLDSVTAFDVYREVIREAGGGDITRECFFEIAKAYPFGISRMEEELVVRDPFSVNSRGALVCVGSVPRGAFVHVLHGDEESLIAAAADAREQIARNRARLTARGGTDGTARETMRLFFDCISRVLFLGDRFPEELRAVTLGASALVGACSIGEVANNGDSYLEFYNKTAVVADIEH